MKISPIAQGGTPGVNLTDTSSAVTHSEAQAGQSRLDIKKIKMRTNASPNRFEQELEAQADPKQAEGAKSDIDVPAQVVEATQPLSPQVAALAKERRSIQRERMELEKLKKELTSKPPMNGNEELITRIKTQPLSVLQEHGVTYDQLTEAILNSSTPTPDISKLKEEITQSVKQDFEKTLSERDTAAEKRVLAEMQKEATELSKEGDAFELIREERGIPTVVDLIYRTYKETGEVLDVTEAMQLVESELLKDNLRRAQFKKIQSQLTPAPQPVQPKQNYMRTLTNRDSSSVGLSRKERAILAMRGELK